MRDAHAHPTRIGADVVDAIRHDLAFGLVLEVVNPDAVRIALGAIIRSTVPEVADQLFLLRIDGDDGLACRLRLERFRVDVLELRVAVGMARAFLCLAVRLTREAEFDLEQLADRRRAHRVTEIGQGASEFLAAFRYPQQRASGVAHRRRLDEALEIIEQRRVVLDRRVPPAAGAPRAAIAQRRRFDIAEPAPDRAARQARQLGNRREAAMARRQNLTGGKHAAPALVELRADRSPPRTNRLSVDHARPLQPPQHSTEPRPPESLRRTPPSTRFTYCRECP